jgi:hypothetical protein
MIRVLLVGLVALQLNDQILYLVLDHTEGIDEFFNPINQNHVLAGQLPLTIEMEEEGTTAHKGLNVALEVIRQVRFELREELALAASPFDEREWMTQRWSALPPYWLPDVGLMVWSHRDHYTGSGPQQQGRRGPFALEEQ